MSNKNIVVVARFADNDSWTFECVDSADVANAIEAATKQALYNGNKSNDLGAIEIYQGNSWIEIPWVF